MDAVYGAEYAWVGLAVLVVAGAAAGWFWRSKLKAKAAEVREDFEEAYDGFRD